jgi:hypothetical protein
MVFDNCISLLVSIAVCYGSRYPTYERAKVIIQEQKGRVLTPNQRIAASGKINGIVDKQSKIFVYLHCFIIIYRCF